MAEINFGILDTQSPAKIGNAFIRTPEQQNANMLQMMQMQQLMDQREQAQYALGKSRREETGLAAFGAGFKALGPDPTPDAIAQLFMAHPSPEMQKAGLGMLQEAKATAAYGKLPPMGGAAAPAALPNQLATTAGAIPTAAPANAMTAEGRIAQLQARWAQLSPLAKYSPQAKAEQAMLVDEIKELRKPQNVAPGGVLLRPGLPTFTAPVATSQDIRTMQALGYPNTQAGYAAFRDAQRQDRLLTPEEEAQRVRIAGASRALAQPRTQQVQMLDGTLGIMNMDTGAITAGTMGGEQVKGKSAATAEKALTESQGNATAYGLRMKESEAILEDLAKQGVLRGAIVEAIPFVGSATGKALPSALGGTSEQQQQVNQAKSNFITAVLRKESGAVISDSEFAREDNKYFPQINDGPAVIKQKANARRLAIEAMKFQAGPGAKEIDKYVPNEATGKTSATLSEPPPGAVRPRGSR